MSGIYFDDSNNSFNLKLSDGRAYTLNEESGVSVNDGREFWVPKLKLQFFDDEDLLNFDSWVEIMDYTSAYLKYFYFLGECNYQRNIFKDGYDFYINCDSSTPDVETVIVVSRSGGSYYNYYDNIIFIEYDIPNYNIFLHELIHALIRESGGGNSNHIPSTIDSFCGQATNIFVDGAPGLNMDFHTLIQQIKSSLPVDFQEVGYEEIYLPIITDTANNVINDCD